MVLAYICETPPPPPPHTTSIWRRNLIHANSVWPCIGNEASFVARAQIIGAWIQVVLMDVMRLQTALLFPLSSWLVRPNTTPYTQGLSRAWNFPCCFRILRHANGTKSVNNMGNSKLCLSSLLRGDIRIKSYSSRTILAKLHSSLKLMILFQTKMSHPSNIFQISPQD